MGQVLYNKYRSKNFSEVIGQEHITRSLDNALGNNHIAHAYLFTGPRGVGKTSVARILAHAVNNLSYDDDTVSMDIIEIDAASNRGIDEIRDLRDKINIVPSSNKYKVYIIDEVHMLTTQAFNALLKTLEEPPEHAIFILATTESSKLPETIVSRTQRYSFKPINDEHLIKQLKLIANKEKIKVTDDALASIAKHGDGSFRDSISILDQLRNRDNKITVEDVNESLGLAPEAAIEKLISLLESGDQISLIQLINELFNSGMSASIISSQLSQTLRSKVFIEGTKYSFDYLRLMEDLIEIPSSSNSDSLLEIVLFKSINIQQPISEPIIYNKTPVIETVTKKESPVPIENKVIKKVHSDIENDEVKIEKVVPSKRTANKVIGDIKFNKLIWQDLLNEIKKTNNTLYGVVRMAKPNLVDDTLELIFGYKFHQQRINEAKNKEIVSNILQSLTGHSIDIICTYKADMKKEVTIEAENDTQDIKNINNIFGETKVIES